MCVCNCVVGEHSDARRAHALPVAVANVVMRRTAGPDKG